MTEMESMQKELLKKKAIYQADMKRIKKKKEAGKKVSLAVEESLFLCLSEVNKCLAAIL